MVYIIEDELEFEKRLVKQLVELGYEEVAIHNSEDLKKIFANNLTFITLLI